MLFDFFKKNKQTPHFFCESCGAEVIRNAKNCHSCGSVFASVRCPACDFVGEEALFKGGCPECGYSSKAGGKNTKGDEPVFPDSSVSEGGKPAGALPVWVYFLTAAAFTAILAAIFFKALA